MNSVVVDNCEGSAYALALLTNVWPIRGSLDRMWDRVVMIWFAGSGRKCLRIVSIARHDTCGFNGVYCEGWYGVKSSPLHIASTPLLESPTSIYLRIRIFAGTAKLILAFTRVFVLKRVWILDIREYQSSIRAPTISRGLRYIRLLCKGVIYTIRGPNIQLYMREYTLETINLMYGAQSRVQIMRI
jgi:hypothetical protein